LDKTDDTGVKLGEDRLGDSFKVGLAPKPKKFMLSVIIAWWELEV